jgi:glycosyltransferase involved in cell wall biosynthesis
MLVRLGIYCDSEVNGGHEEMLKRLMLALVASANVDVLYILVPTANEALFRFVVELSRAHSGVEAIGLSFTAESMRGDMFGLMRAIRSTAATLRTLQLSKLLIAQGTIASGLAGLFAARRAGVTAVSYLPLVDDAPENAGSAEKIKWSMKRMLYRMPNEFITLNDHLRGKLNHLAPHARAMILENYVDDSFSCSTLSKSAARAKLGLPDDGTTIIAHVGRLNFQQKRQDFFMEAIERHAHAFARTLVLIVGEGPDEQRLKAMIQASPALSACVRMVGPQADVLPYIAASDALVLPSAYEGVPLVMIEAVLAERPIVVSRVSGLDSYLPDALLFPAGDHDAFVERIFASTSIPLTALANGFRRRFSREVFDAQAQNVVLPATASRNEANRGARNRSDAWVK